MTIFLYISPVFTLFLKLNNVKLSTNSGTLLRVIRNITNLHVTASNYLHKFSLWTSIIFISTHKLLILHSVTWPGLQSAQQREINMKKYSTW